MSALAPILQGFFTDKLLRQRQASPNTVAAYRDTCKLLLDFASRQARKQPCQLDLADLDAPLITAFLQHLETGRASAVATRNARLAAIRSLFRYAALHAPEHAAQISRVLAIPPKRCDRAIVSFLTAEEIDALLAAPDKATWLGRRDHALLLLAAQTGLRVPTNAYGSRPRIKALSGPAITPGCRPEGLDIVQAIAGGGNWGIDGDAALGRVAWAQLGWPGR
jgi:integrase/recombinase XerD